MKYSCIIVLAVALSLRLSAQADTILARQNTSGQINTSTSGKGTKVQGKTKAGEEGSITTNSRTGNNGDRSGNSSATSSQTTNTKSSQKGKTASPKKSIATTSQQTKQSKNANNRNGSKTNSSTTTSGSGKKDM